MLMATNHDRLEFQMVYVWGLGAHQSSRGLLGGSNPTVSNKYVELTGTIVFAGYQYQHDKMPTMTTIKSQIT